MSANQFYYDNLYAIKGNSKHIVAVSSGAGEISIWSIQGDKPSKVRTLKGISQPKDVKMVDEQTALVLCNRELILYNLDEGVLKTKLKGVMNQKMPFYGLHDERYAVALSRNRMYVNFMNLETGDLETTFKVGEDRFLNSLLVSANGKVCVCGDETQKPFPLLVWDLSNRKLVYDLRFPHHEFITRLSAISDDGHYVVSVSKELNSASPNFIVVYDLQSGMLFKKWKTECNSTSIAISSQGGCVINGLESNEVLVWDLATGDKRHTLTGHTAPVDKLKISEAGNHLLSYDSSRNDNQVKTWNLVNGECVSTIEPEGRLSCCHLSFDGSKMIYGLEATMDLQTLRISDSDETDQVYGDPSRTGYEFEMAKD